MNWSMMTVRHCESPYCASHSTSEFGSVVA